MSTSSVSSSKCVSCKKPLVEGASKCPYCASYQAKWKNNLRYLANIIAFFTAIPTLLVFLITMTPEAWKTIFPKHEIEVVNFASVNNITVKNSGNDKVLISHVTYSSQKPPFSAQQQLNFEILPGEIKSYPLSSDISNLIFLTKLNDVEWSAALLDASGDGECFHVTVFHPYDPLWLEALKVYKDSIRTFKADVAVFYYPASKNKLEEVYFDAIGTVKLDFNNCAEKLGYR